MAPNDLYTNQLTEGEHRRIRLLPTAGGIIAVLLASMVGAGGWWLSNLDSRVQRLDTRLDRVPEMYSTKGEVGAHFGEIRDQLRSLNNRIDALIRLIIENERKASGRSAQNR